MANDDEEEMVEIELELDEDIVQQVEELADELGLTFDQLIRQIIREQLDRDIE